MPVKTRIRNLHAALAALCLLGGAALAAPSMAAVDLQFTPVSDRRAVVDINHAGDGSGRLFLVEQSGTIVIHRDGEDRAEPFLDITDRVETGGERGLLSVAFAPDYAASGLFYTWYTRSGGDTVLSRFRVGDDADRADPDSEQVLLEVAQPYSNHNGGRLRFGPDGMLYLGLGDGGSANDPLGAGQDGATLTTAAFDSVPWMAGWFKWVLMIAIVYALWLGRRLFPGGGEGGRDSSAVSIRPSGHLRSDTARLRLS